jgi:hypothetical protein
MPLKRLSENPFWVCTECESILRDYPISIEVVAEEIMDNPPLYEFCWSRIECDSCTDHRYIQLDIKTGEACIFDEDDKIIENVREVEERDI